MIHQFIYAAPRPGMDEAAFHRYWLDVHAVRYASRIPQIRRYLIDTRIARAGETAPPRWSGVAEIWLANEAEQLASLQSPEFLQGARLDEPNWAAFWMTIVLDTDQHLLLPGPAERRDAGLVKRLLLAKRREGLPRAGFRDHMLGRHAELAMRLPGLRRYAQGHVRDGGYAIGEPLLDVVEQFWFDDVDAADAAQRSLEQAMLAADYRLCTEERTLHPMLVEEHWIIGPEARPYPAAAPAAG